MALWRMNVSVLAELGSWLNLSSNLGQLPSFTHGDPRSKELAWGPRALRWLSGKATEGTASLGQLAAPTDCPLQPPRNQSLSALRLLRPLCRSLHLETLISAMLIFLGSFSKSTNIMLSSFFFFKERNYILLNQQRTNETITIMFVLRIHSKINGSNHSQEVCKEHLIPQMSQLIRL